MPFGCRKIRGLALTRINELRLALGQGGRIPDIGLVAELEALAHEFRALGLRVELVTVELNVNPSNAVADSLVRAVREALTNVYRHSEAAHAVVRASYSNGHIEIVIRDHGCGFDTAAILNARGRRHAEARSIARRRAATRASRVAMAWRLRLP